MLPCTIHVGAPKTGSTAIQDALCRGLRDRRFHYLHAGFPNGSLALDALFLDPPANERAFRRLGRPGANPGPPAVRPTEPRADFAAHRQRMLARWNDGIERARRRRLHLVMSAETTWIYPEHSLRRLRDALRNAGFEPRIIGYVRPWRPWLTSLWTHQVRYGRRRFDLLGGIDAEVFDVRANAERLWSIFRRERVELLKFDRPVFPRGCVVRDLCRRIGFEVPERFALRANEGFSGQAVRLAYCFHRFRNPLEESELDSLPEHWRATDQLRALTGPEIRLDPQLLAPWLESRRAHDRWMERELGFSLEEPEPDPRGHETVRCEADLFEFEEATLAWLAARARSPVIRERSGEAAARAVAEQVDRLRSRRRSIGEIGARLAARLRMMLGHRGT